MFGNGGLTRHRLSPSNPSILVAGSVQPESDTDELNLLKGNGMLSNTINSLLSPVGLRVSRIDNQESQYWAAELAYWEQELRTFYREQYCLDLHPLQTDPSVVPPPELAGLIQFQNKAHKTGYFATGYRTTLLYQRELQELGHSPQRMNAILEMGVGLGRLLIHYLPFNTELHGCDVTPEVAEWTANRYADQFQIARTELDPPLPYSDGQFDFVYANSVFTHVPNVQVAAWVEELARVIRPGGLLIFSMLDANHYMQFLAHREFDQAIRQTGCYEWNTDLGVRMMTFCTNEKIRRDWGGSFDVLDIRQHFREQMHVICRRS